MNQELKKLREQRNTALARMKALHATAEKESRLFTEAEEREWNDLSSRAEQLVACTN